tara:strand:- start:561 stop:830 length:270 start_codon:yes stop_codon:yes gene_type:complete
MHIKQNNSCFTSTFENKSVILNSDTGIYFEFDIVASFIWSKIGIGTNISDLENEVINHFNGDTESMRISLHEFIEKLKKNGFIETNENE